MKGRSLLTASELARMKASVATVVPSTYAEERRMARKKLSDDRKNRWPNTLEALRAKKERAQAEREAILEGQRQEVDKKEAELQKSEGVAQRWHTVKHGEASDFINLRWRPNNNGDRFVLSK